MNNVFCIITTINYPTKAIEVLYEKFGSNLIVVGDAKTPADWNYKDVPYLLNLPPEKKWYEGYAPANSYARKNLGYLEAMRRGAECIYSTDDDNCPNENWNFRDAEVHATGSVSEGWVNVYQCFIAKNIWPRGFSLKQIKHDRIMRHGKREGISSIQQGLADGEPDVDAIYRLTTKGEVSFKIRGSVYLNSYSWCPFNSQSTWFFSKAFPLMYLPVYATMRCTDIWSSFVAQRCLWEMNEGVTFHSPSEVFQERNPHDLMKDFEDEIPGYLHNDKIVEILSALKLKEGEENTCGNMLTCYQSLVDNGILPETEIRSLKAWIKDYEKIAATNLG